MVTVTRRSKHKKKPQVASHPKRDLSLSVIQPTQADPKSGCFQCPIFPFTSLYAPLKEKYQRNGDSYIAKLKEPHTIKTHRVAEPYTEVDILFVGEFPNQTDDQKGKPLSGSQGGMLRSVADALYEDWKIKYGTTNLVRCRTPQGRKPSHTIVQSCGPELVREIKERNPKVVVTLGGPATTYVTSQTGIANLQGNVLRADGIGMPDLKVVPCYAPGYVLKFDHEWEHFENALTVAGKVAIDRFKYREGQGQYSVLNTVEEIEQLVDDLIERGDPVAFDTETGSLNEHVTRGYPQLLCFSLSVDEGSGYTIPFDHLDSPWAKPGDLPHVPPEPPAPKTEWRNKKQGVRTLKWENYAKWEETAHRIMDAWEDKVERWDVLMPDRERVIRAMIKLFRSGLQFVAQNEKFDRKHISHAFKQERKRVREAMKFEFPRDVIDTMTMHMTVEDRRGSHGLKALAHNHTGMGGYELPLERYLEDHPEADPDKGGSYALIPGEILFKYAAMDTDVTIRVHNDIRNGEAYNADPQFAALAEDFLPRLSAVLADMEYEGAMLDIEVVDELGIEFREKIEDALEEIMRLPEVRQYEADQIKAGRTGKRKSDRFEFNPGSDQQLRTLLFDYYGCVPTELTDTGFDTLRARQERLSKSSKSGAVTFRDVLVKSIENREWEFFSVKADVLQSYKKQGNDIAPCILEYRKYKKLLSTYIEPIYDRLDPNKMVHGTFLLHGTVTGRLASRQPNLQNIPYAAKPAYVSRFGDEGCLLQADYSQVELRVAACWYNEPEMIRAYLEDADLHTLTAIAISGLSEDEYAELDEKTQKEWRTRAKRINFGILYGGGPPALQKTLLKDGVELSVEECQDLIDVYFKKRPALKKGIERSESLAKKQGYLASFTGRRRLLPEVFSEDPDIVSRALRQAINFPIQSGASDMTLMSLVLLAERMKAEGLRSRVVLTVHDSIIIDCHVDELLYVARMAKEIMENIIELSSEIMPDIDWSWMTVPIKADLEAGFSWGHLVSFDPTEMDEDSEGDGDLFWKDEEGTLKFRNPVSEQELLESMVEKYAA